MIKNILAAILMLLILPLQAQADIKDPMSRGEYNLIENYDEYSSYDRGINLNLQSYTSLYLILDSVKGKYRIEPFTRNIEKDLIEKGIEICSEKDVRKIAQNNLVDTFRPLNKHCEILETRMEKHQEHQRKSLYTSFLVLGVFVFIILPLTYPYIPWPLPF